MAPAVTIHKIFGENVRRHPLRVAIFHPEDATPQGLIEPTDIDSMGSLNVPEFRKLPGLTVQRRGLVDL